MKEINPDRVLPEQAKHLIAELAQRQARAGGILMQAINFVGGQVQDGLRLLPKSARSQFDAAVRSALLQSYEAAHKSRQGAGERFAGERINRAFATLSGALGGIGGLPTALLELPVATTVIFRAVQDIADAHGEDPTSPEARLECLRVFGAGGPGGLDDGVDTAFIGARLSITGSAVQSLVSKIAPRFGIVISQKIASQAVPIIGAAAGAGTNYAFINYYSEMANVHFGLRKIARDHDPVQVVEAFHEALAQATGKAPLTHA